MKATVALGMVLALMAAVSVGSAQPPGQGPPPRMRGMMQDMGPMMMQMHQQHALMSNDWAATKDAVFVLRGPQLLKYDEDLKLVKTVDLPKHETSADQSAVGDSDPQTQRPRMQQRMRRMMAHMHSTLPARIQVVSDSLFVAEGNRLLKYDEDLNLKRQVELPTISAEQAMDMCPMCRQMMQRMQQTGGAQGNP